MKSWQYFMVILPPIEPTICFAQMDIFFSGEVNKGSDVTLQLQEGVAQEAYDTKK